MPFARILVLVEGPGDRAVFETFWRKPIGLWNTRAEDDLADLEMSPKFPTTVRERDWGDQQQSGDEERNAGLVDLDVHGTVATGPPSSAYHLTHWSNDVAKDDSGRVIPDC